jgi:predicted TIM-barrel fold metal-dependent hydrolase
MRHFVRNYGPERLLFGSDFPFGAPGLELRKVEALNLPSTDLAKILSGNLLTLMADIRIG